MTLTLADLERDALPTLLEFATIPSISPSYDPQWRDHGEIARATELLASWARDRTLRDFTVTVHQIDDCTPLIVVDVTSTAATTGTVMLYGHLDKQPPLGEWSEGLDPFVPVRRGDRVYARGIADDGYSLFSALLALEELERAGTPHARCVVVIEASEESGSTDLAGYMRALSDSFGDVELLICLDSGAFTYDRLWVTTSLRGNLIAEVTVEVLERGQHSGSASGVVPSSFRVMRQLIDRIEDPTTGHILVPELHGEIPQAHRDAAARVTSEFGDVAGGEMPIIAGLELMGDTPTERLLARTWSPTLSVTGVGGIPDVHSAGNVLRPSTTLVLSLRLPPNVSGHVAEEALTRVLTDSPPSHALVRVRTESADGWLSPPLAPWLRDALESASQRAFAKPAEFAGEGGTIPFLALLAQRFPKVQFVATGCLGPGSNAHGIDEMLDLPTMVGITNAITHLVAVHAVATSPS